MPAPGSTPAPSEDAPRRRRPRYPGTHPRHFAEKYKEHAPEHYPGIVEHVRARGQTPAGQHVPVLPDELLEILAPRAGERGVDCTLGFGGHAERVLAQLAPGGTLLALDVDPLEGPRTEERLRAAGASAEALIVRRTNFAGLPAELEALGWSEGADFVYADLGLSSMQIDDPARGFTWKHAGPLDMRMNPRRGLSAAQWLARADEAELARVLRANADEPRAAALARALAARRGTLESTTDLAAALRAALPATLAREDVESTVRRVFQALRIEVNDELGALAAWLQALPRCLRPGGRVAVISFHSGEDRRVKHALRAGHAAGLYAEICAEPVRCSPAERRANPRAAPAKLRWARVA